LLRRRYAYRFALFSATGFDQRAVTLGYAHGITLVDLSTPSFEPLRSAVRLIAHGAVRAEQRGIAIPLPVLRRSLRRVLEPHLELPSSPAEDELPPETLDFLRGIRAKSTLNDLLLGVPDAPFVLVLQPDDLEAFLRESRARPRHRVRVQYRFEAESTEWEVIPVSPVVGIYRLVFALPAELDEWILGSDGTSVSMRARHLKGELLRNISVLWTREGYDEMFRLEYEPQSTELPRSRR